MWSFSPKELQYNTNRSESPATLSEMADDPIFSDDEKYEKMEAGPSNWNKDITMSDV